MKGFGLPQALVSLATIFLVTSCGSDAIVPPPGIISPHEAEQIAVERYGGSAISRMTTLRTIEEIDKQTQLISMGGASPQNLPFTNKDLAYLVYLTATKDSPMLSTIVNGSGKIVVLANGGWVFGLVSETK